MATTDLLKALSHPIRRSILRFLLNSPAPATSSELRQVITSYVAPSLVNFHLDILLKTGVVIREKPIGSRGSAYRYTQAVDVEWFQTVLKLTATEDQNQPRAPLETQR